VNQAAQSTARMADQEVQRRATLVADQERRLQQADALFIKHKTQEALLIYADVFTMLPDVPLAQEVRNRALEGYIRAGVDRATELMNAGDYPSATKILDDLDSPSVAKGNKTVARTRARMLDPDRYPPALTPGHIEKVGTVEKLLLLANSYHEIGDYDSALQTFYEVLRRDPYNSAARRGMERTEQDRTRYFETAKDHQRAKMLNGVNKLWEDPIPVRSSDITNLFGGEQPSAVLGGRRTGRELITTKLRDLIIQRIDFSGASLEEVVEYLRVRSRDLDPDRRGLDFVVSVAPGTPPQSITLNLLNVPIEEVLRYVTEIAGLTYRIEDFAVRIISQSDAIGSIISKTYRVPPDFITSAAVDPAAAAGGADPFATNAAPAGTGMVTLQPIRRLGAKEFLESRGVTFPEGTAASYNPTTNTLVVRNTQRNIETVDLLVDQAVNSSPKEVIVEVRILEVNQHNLNELGFDWLLGGHGVNADNILVAGGTQGNQQNDNFLGAANFPFQTGAGPLGQNPITAGLRSSGDATRANVDDLITGTIATGTNRSPGQFSVAGVFTDPQFQGVIRALNQKRGIDLMAQPSVVTKSGQKATVTIAREFIYPTEFDPPQVPTNTGTGFSPITPATPTAFTTRNVGAILDVEPIISEDGRTVDVTINPTFTDFVGFVNYGSPILTANLDGTRSIELTNNGIIQPIFSTRHVATSVKVWDGATVALGGLITDENVMIEDKVPVVGDIPFLGRLFRSKVSKRKVRNLVFFITVKVIDPSGNRIHRNAP
jgi:general secretion pathway protein D